MRMQRYLTGGIAAAYILAAVLSSVPLAGAQVQRPSAATIRSLIRRSMAAGHLKAAIVQIRMNGQVLYNGGAGESMSGVPATPDMHFRNGALAFTYMSTLLLEMVDRHKVTLTSKLSGYFPDLPDANRVTLKDLAQMTSGYADYVYQPETMAAVYRDPFRTFTPEQLIQIGTSKPMQFEPGTNWGYSHTNYVILGRVLEKICGMPLAEALSRYVLKPMGLKQTAAFTTPYVPPPVLHAFSSERREALGIAAGVPFYEEATYWNPSWTTVEGAVEVSDLSDLNTSLEAVAAGKLLSKASSYAQIHPALIGFGHTQPNCPACRENTKAFNYGLGVILTGSWITQTLGFAGASGAVGYLPSKKLAIAVEVTNGPGAYDSKGNAGLGAVALFRELAGTLAPNTLPAEH